ncbi:MULTISPECIES: helix-turn-helix transcriptional regulator [unclassified Pseudofrankia]|uniref:ArsR/SmtB family transcription factor n=1 Tax=unclassified Pseudofrankia TaxID=2994372 RepID=UPI0008D9D9AD|nr:MULTISPECIES: metalloregulator ArsR/SmtB family transcription factor [unclassified Pseudofrankia]MDT3442647.1 metalloregulator ArsR/SmtB family transcription factor [Pseudofrankia sp. BMG5.37]OHV65572.1 transcriptional regulator [Pseudofrankia sp. BMG5.36]
METVFAIIAEPSRRRILDALRTGEQSVGDLVATLGMSQPATSKQLRVLRDAGLVSSRIDAQRRVYRIEPAPLRALDDWLAPYRALWADSLDALERHLDETARAENQGDQHRGTTEHRDTTADGH